jgi:ATP-dependent DNA helicase RecG
MAGEWREVKLAEVTEFLTGFPFKSEAYSGDSSEPRLLRGDNVAQGFLRWDGVKHWPKAATAGVEAYWLEKGDVILAMDRPWIEAGLKYAAIREADLPALLVQRVARLRGTAALETTFLKYVIGSQAFTEHVLAVQTGTTIPHISGVQIKSFQFRLPPLSEQRAIAHILGTLDDKIELNRRMNETLEAMARALFKSWFVDIDVDRIKEVWVGIEDPDPTVDRKGIKYLQDSGVTVHLFDRDLQEEIQEANKAFIEQALERAAVAREERPKTITLSPLENASATAVTKDLSSEALKQYRAVAKVRDAVDSPAFNRRLVQQGLLKQENGRTTPTGFGLLLFGKEPRMAMPQAGLLGTIHFADGTEEPKDFDGSQVLAPEQALQWLRDKLPNPIQRSAARRRQTNEPLFELVREGVVNALVHRDYAIEGAKCQLIVTPDTITVKSPGLPVEPITLEQMQSFKTPILSRNPVLHYVFARMELAEERGLGLRSMKARAEAAGLPLPRFAWETPYLVLTLFRTAGAAIRALGEALLRELTAEERIGWSFLTGRTKATQSEYAQHLGVTARTAQRHLTHFVALGMLRRSGRGPATEYEVLP